MKLEEKLKERSNSVCELCISSDNLGIYEIPPKSNPTIDNCAYLCETCSSQIDNPENIDEKHWHCLNDSMWSEVDGVKVLAWRMLTRLKKQDLLDMMYLEEDTLKWAQATGEGEDESMKIIHKDSNGVTLESGDTVVLIKDLNVKGGGFTAKRGTAVRRISLVHDNAEHIEGRVEGQHIVILTQYVKKTN